MKKGILLIAVLAMAVVFAWLKLRHSGPREDPPRHSRLWGKAGELWSPSAILGDFRYAGYGLGRRPIPNVTEETNVKDFGASGDGTSDESRAFLAAIAACGREGGTVFVPAGRYLLMTVLKIDRSNVVLRGEGVRRTVLYFPKPLSEILGAAPRKWGKDGVWSWGGGVIWLAGQDRGLKVADVISEAERGERTLTLSDASAVRPGTLVRLVQYETDGSLWEALHGGPAPAGPNLLKWASNRLIDWVSPVVEVHGNQIVLERPLRVPVRSRWRPALFTHAPSVTEVGIENLTIEFPPTAYGGHHREAGFNGVFLENVHQFWIRNIEILDADSGVVSDGVSRFGTISNIRLSNDRRGGSRFGGQVNGHHGISLEGPQDILVTAFRIETCFIHDLTVDSLSNGNVFSKGRGIDLSFDHHTGAPFENLFTDIDAGAGTRLWKSGGTVDTWGPHSAARETFWNIRMVRSQPEIPSYPHLILVGFGNVSSSPFANHWVEAMDQSWLLPQDIHVAQIEHGAKGARSLQEE